MVLIFEPITSLPSYITRCCDPFHSYIGSCPRYATLSILAWGPVIDSLPFSFIPSCSANIVIVVDLVILQQIVEFSNLLDPTVSHMCWPACDLPFRSCFSFVSASLHAKVHHVVHSWSVGTHHTSPVSCLIFGLASLFQGDLCSLATVG
jgi:hypothetical protein